MGAVVRGGAEGARGTNTERILGYFPWMGARRDQQAGTLSGGEQQMLALVRALVSNPKLSSSTSPRSGSPRRSRASSSRSCSG